MFNPEYQYINAFLTHQELLKTCVFIVSSNKIT